MLAQHLLEEILLPAFEHSKRRQRLQLLRHYCVAGRGPELWLGHLAEDDRIEDIIWAGHDGITKTDY
mgnify:CR=1 FL=1